LSLSSSSFFQEFSTFTSIEFAAGNGMLDLPSAVTAVENLLEASEAQPRTLDFMAALGACYIAADSPREDSSMQDIWRIVKKFEERKVVPNKMTGTHFIGVVVKLASVGKAGVADGFEVLEWCKEQEVDTDFVIIAQMMNVCAKAAGFGAASYKELREVVEWAKGLGVKQHLNVFSFTSMMDGVAKAATRRNATVEDGDEVMKLMSEYGIRPNSRTFSSYFTVCANVAAHVRVKTMDQARMRWEQMTASDLQPMTGTFNAYLNCLAKNAMFLEQPLAEGREVIRIMKENELERNETTYLSLIEIIQRSLVSHPKEGKKKDRNDDADDDDEVVGEDPVEEAFGVVEEMKEEEIEVTCATYNAITAVIAKAVVAGKDNVKESLERVDREMEERGISPDVSSFATRMEIIAKLTGRGRATFSDGIQLLQEMRKQGISPTTNVFNILMDVTAKASANGNARLEDGLGILQWMKSFETKPDLRTYNSLMDLMAKSARFRQTRVRHGLEVLDRIEKDQLERDCYTVTSFIQLAKEDGSVSGVEEAREVFSLFPPHLRSDRTYTVMIAAEARIGSGREVVENLLKDAVSNGIAVNNFMLNAAMSACKTAQDVLDLHAEYGKGVEIDSFARELIRRAKEGAAPNHREPRQNDPLLKGVAYRKARGIVSL